MPEKPLIKNIPKEPLQTDSKNTQAENSHRDFSMRSKSTTASQQPPVHSEPSEKVDPSKEHSVPGGDTNTTTITEDDLPPRDTDVIPNVVKQHIVVPLFSTIRPPTTEFQPQKPIIKPHFETPTKSSPIPPVEPLKRKPDEASQPNALRNSDEVKNTVQPIKPKEVQTAILPVPLEAQKKEPISSIVHKEKRQTSLPTQIDVKPTEPLLPESQSSENNDPILEIHDHEEDALEPIQDLDPELVTSPQPTDTTPESPEDILQPAVSPEDDEGVFYNEFFLDEMEERITVDAMDDNDEIDIMLTQDSPDEADEITGEELHFISLISEDASHQEHSMLVNNEQSDSEASPFYNRPELSDVESTEFTLPPDTVITISLNTLQDTVGLITTPNVLEQSESLVEDLESPDIPFLYASEAPTELVSQHVDNTLSSQELTPDEPEIFTNTPVESISYSVNDSLQTYDIEIPNNQGEGRDSGVESIPQYINTYTYEGVVIPHYLINTRSQEFVLYSKMLESENKHRRYDSQDNDVDSTFSTEQAPEEIQRDDTQSTVVDTTTTVILSQITIFLLSLVKSNNTSQNILTPDFTAYSYL